MSLITTFVPKFFDFVSLLGKRFYLLKYNMIQNLCRPVKQFSLLYVVTYVFCNLIKNSTIRISHNDFIFHAAKLLYSHIDAFDQNTYIIQVVFRVC